MPVCIRFTDKQLNIREELLEIHLLPRITGHQIATTIKDVLTGVGIDISNYRGQGYDGARNWSRDKVSIQALIREDAPLTVYTHCSGALSEHGDCSLLPAPSRPQHTGQDEGNRHLLHWQPKARTTAQRSDDQRITSNGFEVTADRCLPNQMGSKA